MISDILTARVKQIDKSKFFELYRSSFGKLSQKQVDALNVFIDLTNDNITQLTTKQWAYAYATTYHETNKTFEPVEEAFWLENPDDWRKRNLYYYPFFGRGYVQTTHEENYRKQSVYAADYFGEDTDFVQNPDLCLVPKYAFFNLWYGMKYGIYTGRKIGDYISTLTVDYINARRVINGTDEAQKIANYAKSFEYILENSII